MNEARHEEQKRERVMKLRQIRMAVEGLEASSQYNEIQTDDLSALSDLVHELLRLENAVLVDA